MMQLVNLTVEYGGRALFKDVTWQLNSVDRVALIGPNGAGKSTILKIIAGLQFPTSGSIAKAKDLRVGYLPQDGLHAHGKTLLDEALTAFEEITRLREKMHQLEHAMAETPHDDPKYAEIIDDYGHAHARLESLDGYAAESKAARILNGLGFSEADFVKPCELFSGGWQMRIALAKLLLQKPEILLLDEPTNHLDIESIEWLENYLHEYEGSILMVSHDRYFINGVCKRITELVRGTLVDYVGDYENYEEQKALAEMQILAAFERQQSEMARVQMFIDRFRYKATKARQAQSRIKMLERMDKIEVPDEERRTVNFRFPQPEKSGRTVLTATGIKKKYGERTILNGIDFEIERGDRIALVGVNGAGKSTLLKILVGFENADGGEFKLGHNVNLEYFAQQQSDKLDQSKTAYEEIASVAVTQTPLLLRTILGAFLFSGDDIHKKVKVLSGGERSRLAFAKMLLNPANFIILDEPTNHIDAQTKEILQGALMDYEGTLLMVSHDRHFLDALATKVIEVKDGKIQIYPGDYQYYREKKQQESAKPIEKKPEVKIDPKKEKTSEAREAQKQKTTSDRKRSKQLTTLEEAIQKKEAEKMKLEEELADPGLYQQGKRFDEVQKKYKTVSEEIEKLFKEWELLQE